MVADVEVQPLDDGDVAVALGDLLEDDLSHAGASSVSAPGARMAALRGGRVSETDAFRERDGEAAEEVLRRPRRPTPRGRGR